MDPLNTTTIGLSHQVITINVFQIIKADPTIILNDIPYTNILNNNNIINIYNLIHYFCL